MDRNQKEEFGSNGLNQMVVVQPPPSCHDVITHVSLHQEPGTTDPLVLMVQNQ